MSVSFNNIDDLVITFKTNENLKVGRCVKLVANGTVATSGASERFIGIVDSVHGDVAGIKVRGYVKLPYTEPFGLGYRTLTMDADGKLKSSIAGSECLVIEIDSEEAGVFIFQK